MGKPSPTAAALHFSIIIKSMSLINKKLSKRKMQNLNDLLTIPIYNRTKLVYG